MDGEGQTERVLISACLLGERVRYHGGDSRLDHPTLRRWQEEGRLVPLCPEVTGGLPIPRPAAEITDTPDGLKVLTADGRDVSDAFVSGATAAVATCVAYGIHVAILKDGSPSCGVRSIYDGSFSGRRIAGAGITAAALAASGVRVFSEDEIENVDTYLQSIENAPKPRAQSLEDRPDRHERPVEDTRRQNPEIDNHSS